MGEPITVDGGVICVKGELGDWYTLERADHPNTHEMVRDPEIGCMTLAYSGRISDADVEGDGADMLQIADAIEGREDCINVPNRRCAIVFSHRGVELWSPRNSRRPAIITTAQADDLARSIRAIVEPEERELPSEGEGDEEVEEAAQ